MKKLLITFSILLISLSSFAQKKTKVKNVSSFGGHDGSIHVTIVNGVPPYTYLWNTGSTNCNIDRLTSGIYTLKVKGHGYDCYNTYSFNVKQPKYKLGKRTEDEYGLFTSNIEVYPNPSEGLVHLDISSDPSDGFSIRVTDINGKVIMENSDSKFSGEYSGLIDLSNNAKGIYLIQVKTNEEIVNKKIIIN